MAEYLPDDPTIKPRHWAAIHFVKGQTVKEFAAQMAGWVEKGFGNDVIQWEAMGGLLETGDCRLPISHEMESQ